MKKIFGYVELNGEGMKLVGSSLPGPFPVIDMDERFGMEILDHQNQSHWIMNDKFTVLDAKTIEAVKHAVGPITLISEAVKVYEMDAKLDGILVSLSNEERIRLHEKLNVGAVHYGKA